MPDPLVGRPFVIEGDVAADIADAEAAITRLNVEATSLVDTEPLARILLRAESVASSRIEGLEIGARRLLRAEAARDLGDDPRDVTAVEVLGNIDAMAYAIEHVRPGDQITTDLILGVHQRLLANTRLDSHGGTFREQQNWIGGSEYNPCAAAFVPPPPEYVADLVTDLVAFSNDDSLPAVAQAAMAHAQFETIHPFVDGNGRTGRALIHLILRRRGLAPRVLPPVSLILATWSKDYIDALTAYRYRGPATSRKASDGVNLWIDASPRRAREQSRTPRHSSGGHRQSRRSGGNVWGGSAPVRLPTFSSGCSWAPPSSRSAARRTSSAGASSTRTKPWHV